MRGRPRLAWQALAVHGLKAPTSKDWFAAQMGNASYLPPKLTCAPTKWTHARAAGWQLCESQAACDEPGVPLYPTGAELRNLSVPWLPVYVRGMCQKRAAMNLGLGAASAQ